ncbi:MAG: hypothetical protein Q4F96_04150 [Bacillota bacterium]|nr:hypothetical protein [Bacillota bacterium]
MDYRKKIIDSVNRFYFDCVEEFREAEGKIANDSRFRKIFTKKDYGGNIELLRRCRKRTQSVKLPTGDIPRSDDESKEIVHQCNECIRLFNRLCDAYVQMQIALQKKAEGSDLSYKEYMEVYRRTQEAHAAVNASIRELDILYADYTEDESGGDGYLTYAMLTDEDGEES